MDNEPNRPPDFTTKNKPVATARASRRRAVIIALSILALLLIAITVYVVFVNHPDPNSAVRID